MSTRETILAAAASTLVTASVAAGRIYRTRREQLGTLPAVVVEPGRQAGQETMLGVMDHEFEIACRVFAQGDVPETAADATIAAMHAALFANLSLGLGSDVQLLPRYDMSEPNIENYDSVEIVVRYPVTYRTAFASL